MTHVGLHFAATAETPEEDARAVRLMRAFGSDQRLLQACYGRRGDLRDAFGVIAGFRRRATPQDARSAYYRVTGVPFNHTAPPAVCTARFLVLPSRFRRRFRRRGCRPSAPQCVSRVVVARRARGRRIARRLPRVDDGLSQSSSHRTARGPRPDSAAVRRHGLAAQSVDRRRTAGSRVRWTIADPARLRIGRRDPATRSRARHDERPRPSARAVLSDSCPAEAR